MVKLPPQIFDIGVFTPLADCTELRPNEAVMGIEPKKEPRRFPTPSAIISCVASVCFPFAALNKKVCCVVKNVA